MGRIRSIGGLKRRASYHKGRRWQGARLDKSLLPANSIWQAYRLVWNSRSAACGFTKTSGPGMTQKYNGIRNTTITNILENISPITSQ